MLTNIQSLVEPLRGIQDSYIVVFAMRGPTNRSRSTCVDKNQNSGFFYSDDPLRLHPY